ncbi:urease accessory protein UreF [Ochrobactrum teleogrylli]|uniref:Urease accessory protein UreF n=1 Tax=Ochrobactrum teleogrylli TaxID=2479765 RepID=A0ABY2Y2P3_9HYPH|nr:MULTISPECIES: urease accessory UreF family protein [Brucella]TNV12522.1 urease accessory protein UreF [[Ochrobactrum] teleogrylli]WHS29503.1 urease accessory UreF family protein [Brucella sp. NM4]WHT45021.1 urease accessory UreF family protein [Ochrobactrum sp. SSR]
MSRILLDHSKRHAEVDGNNAGPEPGLPVHSPALPMLHLMRLVSPSQPVGAFSYSRGLEWAVHAGTVTNEESCAGWVFGLLEHSYAALDGAIFWRMFSALTRSDDAEFCRLNDWLGASRESSELELEDRRMGESLLTLLSELGVERARNFASEQRATYPAAFAIAALNWNIEPVDALRGLMWSVVESQVMAAIRLVPLGHTAGQKMLIAGAEKIERAVEKACTLEDDKIGNTAPALAMASAWHETQYSRLFRS